MIAARTLLTAFAVVTAVSALGPPSARGYNDEVTHPLINERVYEVSGLDEYFSEQLGAPVDGLGRLSVRYRGSLPAELFQEGGRDEDNPLTRPGSWW